MKINLKFLAGYTLVEYLVVLSLIGIIAAMAVFGVKKTKDAEVVDKTANQILGDLLSLQNKANNGVPSGIASYNFVHQAVFTQSGSSYLLTLNGTGESLDPKVTLSLSSNATTIVCFANPTVTTVGQLPPGCSCGTIACKSPSSQVTSPLEITVNGSSSQSRVVKVEFLRLQIGRIYAQ